MTLGLSRRTFIGAATATVLPLALRAETKDAGSASTPAPRVIEARAGKLRLATEPAAADRHLGFRRRHPRAAAQN